jgi:hypothetical protein
MNFHNQILNISLANRRFEKYHFEVLSLNLAIFFFIFRTANPFFKYPFLLLYFSQVVYFSIAYRSKLLSSALIFFKIFYIVLVALLVLIISYFLSDKLYLIVFKDIINGLILCSVFFFLFVVSKGQTELKVYYRSFIKLIIIFGSLISLAGLLDLFDIVPINDTFRNYYNSGVTIKDTIEFDYNFALLPVFFGLIGMLVFDYRLKARLKNVLNVLLIIISSLQIIFAGSRRGLIMLILLFSIFTVIRIILIWKKSSILERLTLNYSSLLWSIAILTVSIYLFVFETSSSFKNRVFDAIGVRNGYTVRMKITANIYRYASVSNNNLTFNNVFDILWTPTYNPLDPNSGWATSIHSEAYPLTGKNVNIVPQGAIGYKMDWKSDFKCDKVNCYNWTFINSLLKKDSLSESSRNYSASVYCYVTDDYEGSYAKLYAGSTESYYDLNKKGEWQLLKIEYQSDHELDVSIVWAKLGSTNVKNLKGYVIFAYPQYKKNAIPISDALSYFKDSYVYSSVILNSIPEIFGQIGQIDTDPIRKFTSKLFSEDTVYHGYKKTLIVDTAKNRFVDSRKIHWEFALQIFSKEYNTAQKIFGGGFNFLNWFGYYFGKDKTMCDWPHNPFLTILLYSGIIGLTIFLFLLYKVLFYYLKFFKEYPLFLIFFMVSFFFSFFSGSSPFDPPIMGFFVILPFFIHSTHSQKKST